MTEQLKILHPISLIKVKGNLTLVEQALVAYVARDLNRFKILVAQAIANGEDFNRPCRNTSTGETLATTVAKYPSPEPAFFEALKHAKIDWTAENGVNETPKSILEFHKTNTEDLNSPIYVQLLDHLFGNESSTSQNNVSNKALDMSDGAWNRTAESFGAPRTKTINTANNVDAANASTTEKAVENVAPVVPVENVAPVVPVENVAPVVPEAVENVAPVVPEAVTPVITLPVAPEAVENVAPVVPEPEAVTRKALNDAVAEVFGDNSQNINDPATTKVLGNNSSESSESSESSNINDIMNNVV